MGVLYLQFISTVGVECDTNLFGDCSPVRMTETQAQDWSFGIVILWTVSIVILASRKKISARHLARFKKLLQQLISEERFGTAADLLEPQIALLGKVEARRFLGPSIHEQIRLWNPHPFFDRNSAKPRPVLKHFSWLSVLFPSGDTNRDTVWAIQKEISNSTDFVQYIASKRSRMSFLLATVGGWQRSFYVENLLDALLNDRSSDFYKECNTLYVSSSNPSNFEAESHPFLTTFVKNPKFAEELGIWKPVGDYVLRMTNIHTKSDYIEFLNSPAVDMEREALNDPIFTTTNFFHIMIMQAMLSDVRYHMWLYYLEYFVRNLTQLYDESGDNVDRDAEHPIRNAYFIWTILRTLTSLIEATRDLPDDSSHLNISKPDGSHQNENIPKSAVICISGCLRTILKAPTIGETFKEYCAEIVLGCLQKTKGIEKSPNLYPAFKDSILKPYGMDDREYHNQLCIVFAGIDHVISFELDDVRESLGLQ